jgi:hypothetical protein
LHKIGENTNEGSGMVSLKQVTKLGSHLLVSVSNSNSKTLRINPEELIVRDLWACAYTDGIPLLRDNILVDPFLGHEMFPDVSEHVTSRRMGINTCWICKQVMQRRVHKS